MKKATEPWRQNNTIAIISIALGLILFSTISSAKAVDNSSSIFTADSNPYGKTFGEWGGNWWSWLLSIPKDTNPAADTTGKNCAINQSGPVWFLAGTFGGNNERTCTIPAGKAIMFLIIGTECSFVEYPALKTETDLHTCAKSGTDHVTNMEVSVDGLNIPNLKQYRAQSPLFSFTFPSNNVYGVKAGPTQAVSDGFWILLKPLPAGHHEIRFSGSSVDYTTTGTSTFATAVIYHITSNP